MLIPGPTFFDLTIRVVSLSWRISGFALGGLLL